MEPNVTPSPILTQDTSPLFGGAGKPSSLPFPNPFVGLRPFKTEESLLFFGRSEQTIELLQRLHNTRFLAVVGSSGCGKSSLIRAGLIPKLKAGFLVEDRDRWLTAMMKPGDAPLRNLARSLLEAAFDDVTEPMVDDFVKHIGQFGAEYITTRLAPALGDSSSNLLLLIDQFEEIFRFGVESGKAEQRDEAEDFVALMLALAEQRTLPIYVVLTMRSDFIGDCDNFYGLPEAMNRSQYLVPRLTRPQRQQAIEGPVRLFGAQISLPLLDRVLNDVGDKSDQLPVMQHALMRTWEWREFEAETQRRKEAASAAASQLLAIDLPHYEAAGTITDALSKDADAALNGMTEEELKITERIFQALTDTDENNRRIRRPAYLDELSAIAEANHEAVLKVIKRFSDSPRSFLIISAGRKKDDPLIDISHESLIRQWDQLSKWIDLEKNSREIYLRVVSAAKRFQAGRGEILRGADLQEALDWHSQNQFNEDWGLRYSEDINDFDLAINFLVESKGIETLTLAHEEEQRNRELRRRRTFSAIIGVAFLLALVTTWIAWQQRRRAIEQERTASQLYYVANMNLAQEAFGKKKYAWGNELLKDFLQSSERGLLPVARDFFWYHLWLTTQETLTLKGHENGVNAVTFSPDGKTLASASTDQTIKLWDLASRQNLATLRGHEARVNAVTFSPDGKTLASASSDQTINLWDLASRQNLAILRGHEARVNAVIFSPDGKTLASASEDKTIKLWDLASRQNLATLRGHEDNVNAVTFSPDGKTLASASSDQTVKLWDLASRQILATLKGHEAGVSAVAFSPDGKTLASASWDDTVKLWDPASRQNLAILRGHEDFIRPDSVWSIAFSPDGKTLASTIDDQTVNLWDLASRQILATLRGHEAFIESVAFSPDGKTLASASSDKTVKLWDLASRQNLAILRGHEAFIESVAFSPDGKTLASASDDQTVNLWDLASRQNLATLRGHEAFIESVAFSPDGKTLASASWDNTVKLWDLPSRQILATLKGHEAFVVSVAFSPDGKTLASASGDKTIKLWDLASRQILATLQGHKSYIESVAFSPDGKTLASASGDNTIKLWDLASRQNLATLKGHDLAVRSVAFSPDGKTLASASSDQTIKLWDLASRQNLVTLIGHDAGVKSVAFSSDGKTLASASSDQTVKLWDLASRQNLATLNGHEAGVKSVAFSSDGKTLASAGGSPDGKKIFAIRLWFAATDEEVARQRNK